MIKSANKGFFKPRYPKKYIGDMNNIIFRSSWELDVMKFFDNNVSILQWASESISIPYKKPTDGKIHKYYPDFWIKYKKKDGTIVSEIIELKPEKQTKRPTIKGKKKKTQLFEAITWQINLAKWRSARKFCDKYKIKFRIITEKDVFR